MAEMHDVAQAGLTVLPSLVYPSKSILLLTCKARPKSSWVESS